MSTSSTPAPAPAPESTPAPEITAEASVPADDTAKPLYKKVGGQKDPVFRYATDIITPALLTAVANGKVPSRAKWYVQYNRGDLQKKIVAMVINIITHPSKKAAETKVEAPAPKAPRATSAFEVFRKTHADKIAAEAAPELAAFEAGSQAQNQARPGIMARVTAKLMQADTEGSAQAAEAAKRISADNATPPDGHVAENQAKFAVHLTDALKKLEGEGWGGHGKFMALVAGVVLTPEEHLKAFFTSHATGQRSTNFVPSNLQDLFKELNEYAADVFQGTAPTNPTFVPDTSGRIFLPDVNISSATLGDMKFHLYAFLEAASVDQLRELWTMLTYPPPIAPPAPPAVEGKLDSFSSVFVKGKQPVVASSSGIAGTAHTPPPRTPTPIQPPRSPTPVGPESPLTSRSPSPVPAGKSKAKPKPKAKQAPAKQGHGDGGEAGPVGGRKRKAPDADVAGPSRRGSGAKGPVAGGSKKIVGQGKFWDVVEESDGEKSEEPLPAKRRRTAIKRT
ncbi:hypothetical protein C8F01DRAFT_1169097 [Mycena amicta]|nr:hypothetical protein C8F01DRAFT_1169097 [Mycena amicta]